MAEVGILQPDERLELIDGAIDMMRPIGNRHAGCVDVMASRFMNRLGPRAIVRVQGPIRLSDHSEPQPDIALLHPRTVFDRSGHPGPADLFLVVEVMDSSAIRDRGQKLGLYALSKVPDVWLIDLDGESIEVHLAPQNGVHTRSRVCLRGQNVSPDAFPDITLSVDEILG